MCSACRHMTCQPEGNFFLSSVCGSQFSMNSEILLRQTEIMLDYVPCCLLRPLYFSQKIMMAVLSERRFHARVPWPSWCLNVSSTRLCERIGPHWRQWPHPTKWREGAVNIACVSGTSNNTRRMNPMTQKDRSYVWICDVGCMLGLRCLTSVGIRTPSKLCLICG